MALLAWLMLAVAPIGAWPREMPSQQDAAMVAHASHVSMHMGEASCCADHTGHPDAPTAQTCHCALPCAGVLPSMSTGLADVPATAARYAPPRPLEAPLSGFSPPLRPPLA
ncbi:hypothetical protein [Frateuria sp. STR12]|uniref:hypothetical protein n=1 Tax=Frateuria hangzhouensis TaxID=2995589 RepID=UPI002260942D|nr:hypothetical protein [Frateuria sp. STR12]MCX7512198.1 hypothetical protein [Frateuria sp. STR12]